MKAAENTASSEDSITRALTLVLAGLGALVALGASLADLLVPGGTSGLGLTQVILILAGGTLAAQVVPVFTRGTSLLAHWRAELQTVSMEDGVRFGLIVLQLFLFATMVRLFQIESPAFYSSVVPLAFFGFVAHHVLPMRQRLPFFVALSLGSVLLVLGVVQGLWLIALVLATIAICHLPFSFGVRVVTLLAVVGLFGMLRAGALTAPWSVAVWPILGSMLMFRLIIYMYDLKHSPAVPSAAWSLSYFFMLPNVVFPFFPVVDFSTFRRTYFDRDAIEIYQRGIHWMLRGAFHLLLYRVVYQHLTLAPEDVTTTGDLLQYVLTTFLLYLKVSGLFHLIVGLLHLYGFRLPETHHLFYLASSFTDFWRRINIYWKDFMMKVVFYPTFLPLRRYGEGAALVMATLAVFFVTWFTHSYQWFWILGEWHLSWPDVLFWGSLAVLLIFDSLRELRQGRSRTIGKPDWSTRRSLSLALRTAATFAAISIMWSFWNSPTIGDWLDLVSVEPPTFVEVGMIIGVLLLIGGSAVLADRYGDLAALTGEKLEAGVNAAWRPVLVPLGALGIACALASPSVSPVLGSSGQAFLRDLRVPELNERDARLMERGYYEDLVNVGGQNNALWELYARRPNTRTDIWSSGVLRETDTFLHREMRPFVSIYQDGASFRTNQWGMRDKEYTRVPPPATYRIALLGQSYVAGDGVSDGETFEALAEERLNAEVTGDSISGFEILNFAVGSYSVIQQLLLLERVFTFEPDAVYFVATPNDSYRATVHLLEQVQRGVEPPFPYVRDVIESAGIQPDVRETEGLRRLQPYGDSLVRWALEEIAARCLERGITPVWVYLYVPQVDDVESREVLRLERMAREAGFVTLDLYNVYDGHDIRSLQVSSEDFHPNAEGHRIIAERFYQELVSNEELGVPAEERATIDEGRP